MKIGEAIQRVQSLYSKGVQSRSSRLTPRHTYSALCTARSTIFRQQAGRKQNISDWSYQTLKCVELIEVPIHECPCVPATGTFILRTKFTLPRPIQGMDSALIKSVNTLDGNIRLDIIEAHNAKYYPNGNKYTGKNPNVFIKNNYGYVTVYKKLRAAAFTGLFDDPIAAYNYPSICGIDEDCPECACIDNMDREFPFDGSLATSLYQLANNELIIMFKQMQEDKNNDAGDNNEPGGTMIHQPNEQQQGGE